MPAEKRKPRNTPLEYHQQPKKPKAGDTATQKPRHNLTLADWLTVFAYIDAHPSVPQKDVVEHFATLKTGALLFTQPTLSRKLNNRSDLQARVNANPSALSSKRPRVVTRPDVEKALFLWVKHMEAKGERTNGRMLKEKRSRFEDLFNVPDEERLLGDGWVASFCRTYKIREQRRHGGAGSVNPDAVATEQVQNHTHIQPEPTAIPPHADPTAWAILREFAATDMRLPDAEKRVKDTLGTRYKDSDWQPAFKAVMDAENDTDVATAAIEKLAHIAANWTGLKNRITVPQLALENDAAQSVSDLQAQNHIFRTPPTLDEFLEPPEGAETRDLADVFDGPEGDRAIVAEVVQEMAEKNEVIDTDSDDEDEPSKPGISRAETIDLCEKLMDACLQHGDPSSDVPRRLMTQLRRFRVCLHQEELLHSRQTTLDAFLARPSH